MELQSVPHTLAELEALVREGLPKAALRAGVEHATQDAGARRALLDVALTELSASRVKELLWKLFYGLPA
jgi:hypothetical protein